MLKAIFFDLGKVLVDFDHSEIVGKLLSTRLDDNGPDPTVLFDRLFHPTRGLCSSFNAGRVSEQEFYREMSRQFSLDLPFASFVSIWTEIFSENYEVTDIVKALAGEIPLYLISNTDSLHFNYIISHFPVLHLFQSWILSYKLGVCKPDPAIYQKALEVAGVKPEESVYIDDIAQYVEAARKLGFQGIHFESVQNLKRSLIPFLPPRILDKSGLFDR